MATRLYFRSASSGLSNLPTDEQSTLAPAKVVDAVTVNRTLSETIGTGQTTLSMATLAQTAQQNLYFSKFVSDALNMASLPAQTWTYNFATIQSNLSGNFPTSSSNLPVYICCYVWRPSSTSKVGNVLDGNSASNYDEIAAGAERLGHGTFSGAAVNSMAQGDVLVFEVWFRITQASATSYTDQFCYNGTTANTTKNTSVTNHASFVESPQNFTFDIPPITMTPNAIVVVHPRPIAIV